MIITDVIGPAGPIVEGSLLEAFYVTGPAYFPDDFDVCVEEGRSIVISWLVPVSRREAEFIKSNGGESSEDLIRAEDPNLMDLSRQSLV